jgi:flagellar assembly protein FliH
MGKIVKAAKVRDERYLVDVPAAERDVLEPAYPEMDDRFAVSYASEFASAEFGAPDAEPPVSDPRVDWDAVRADAEAIVDRAAADAEKLLKQAESTALELLAKTRSEIAGVEEEARKHGDERGYDEGKRLGQSELDPAIETFREVAQSIREQRRQLLEQAEPELVRLAMTIAERIVHTEVTVNPNVVLENVRSALTRITSREVVTVRVNPADHDVIRQHRDAIHASSDVEHLRIVEDQRVDRGGVIIETESGTIDAKISTQLKEAQRAILTEDSIALGPSFDDQEMLEPSPAAS